jgi:uncharacterized protein YjbI with pentapeptide repeats
MHLEAILILGGTILNGANLMNARLERSNFTEAELIGANLQGAIMADTKLTRPNTSREI